MAKETSVGKLKKEYKAVFQKLHIKPLPSFPQFLALAAREDQLMKVLEKRGYKIIRKVSIEFKKK